MRAAAGGQSLEMVWPVVIALMLWSLSDSIIEGTLRAQSRRLDNARKRSRLLTVTPLLQGTVRITIGVLALLLILAQLGLNIGRWTSRR